MNQEKACTQCGESKLVNKFGRERRGKYGVKSVCRKCEAINQKEYRHTKIGKLNNLFNDQVTHSTYRGHSKPVYSRHQFVKFGLGFEIYHKLFDEWAASGFDRLLAPSFDRKDDSKGYSFENFNKWMTWEENAKKAHNDVRLGKLKNSGLLNGGHKGVIGVHKKTGEKIGFLSMTEAQRQTGISQSNISATCLGKRDSAGGYYWDCKSA